MSSSPTLAPDTRRTAEHTDLRRVAAPWIETVPIHHLARAFQVDDERSCVVEIGQHSFDLALQCGFPILSPPCRRPKGNH
jgi:hypothetical protein